MPRPKSSKPVKQEKLCFIYDITLFDEIKPDDVQKDLSVFCKSWFFQKEKGTLTDKIHYQIRVSTKIKTRQSTLIKKLQGIWKSFHVSITPASNRTNNFYVGKEDTRVEGPWTDKDYENIKDIPEDIRNLILKPWEADILKELDHYESRIIDVIYDPIGNNDKLTLIKYAMCHKKYNAQLLPFCKNYKDIMRMAYAVGEKKIYFIDIPRALKIYDMEGLMGGIETLKDGFMFEDRNHYRSRYITRPRICLCINKLFDPELFNSDKWKIWSIDNNTLKEISLNDAKIIYNKEIKLTTTIKKNIK